MGLIRLNTIEEFLDKWSYFISKEQLDKLSRDYFKYPLARGEYPNEQDFRYLYLELNLPGIVVMEYFRISYLHRWCGHFKIQKPNDLHVQCIKKMNMFNYGVDSTSKLPQVKEKNKQTCLKKYGVTNGAKTEQSKNKVKETCLKKFGVENAMFSQKLKQKMYDTNYEKFGCKVCTQNEKIKQKLKQKVPQMLEKMEHTNLERYGVKQVLQLEEVREKGKQTNLEKYGVEYASQSNEVQYKVYKTKKTNGTLATSKEEINIFDLLKLKFGENNVISQYMSDEYPFRCDYYIIPLKLYIEYQGYWKHGKEPYSENNPEHQELVQYWEKKSKEINSKGKPKRDYLNAINTWTIRDVLKRETAKKNNLNFKEFFTIKEFNDWFEGLQYDY